MNLEELKSELDGASYSSNLKQIINETKKTAETRLYVNLSSNFSSYFTMFENKPFLKVFIQQKKGFSYAGYKQTDDDSDKCKSAKFKMLAAFSNDGIEGIEKYESEEATLLVPKSSAKKLSL